MKEPITLNLDVIKEMFKAMPPVLVKKYMEHGRELVEDGAFVAEPFSSKELKLIASAISAALDADLKTDGNRLMKGIMYKGFFAVLIAAAMNSILEVVRLRKQLKATEDFIDGDEAPQLKVVLGDEAQS